MRCPVCGNKHEVGKLYEFVRAGKTLTRFFCSACSVEFSTIEAVVQSISVIEANGNVGFTPEFNGLIFGGWQI